LRHVTGGATIERFARDRGDGDRPGVDWAVPPRPALPRRRAARMSPRAAAEATPLAMAKDRARRAYRSAREADPPLSALIDRFHSETLVQVAGQPAAKSAVMFQRIAILFEVVADRRGWPERIR
jgi:hypothetical protein